MAYYGLAGGAPDHAAALAHYRAAPRDAQSVFNVAGMLERGEGAPADRAAARAAYAEAAALGGARFRRRLPADAEDETALAELPASLALSRLDAQAHCRPAPHPSRGGPPGSLCPQPPAGVVPRHAARAQAARRGQEAACGAALDLARVGAELAALLPAAPRAALARGSAAPRAPRGVRAPAECFRNGSKCFRRRSHSCGCGPPPPPPAPPYCCPYRRPYCTLHVAAGGAGWGASGGGRARGRCSRRARGRRAEGARGARCFSPCSVSASRSPAPPLFEPFRNLFPPLHRAPPLAPPPTVAPTHVPTVHLFLFRRGALALPDERRVPPPTSPSRPRARRDRSSIIFITAPYPFHSRAIRFP